MTLRADQDVPVGPTLDVGYLKTNWRSLPVTLPLWPETGNLLGLSRAATFRAAGRGDFPCVKIGSRRLALTVPLLKWLGIPLDNHDPDDRR